jgi:hypothetical protein
MSDDRKQQAIAKLLGARAELDDVLTLSAPGARYDLT